MRLLLELGISGSAGLFPTLGARMGARGRRHPWIFSLVGGDQLRTWMYMYNICGMQRHLYLKI